MKFHQNQLIRSGNIEVLVELGNRFLNRKLTLKNKQIILIQNKKALLVTKIFFVNK